MIGREEFEKKLHVGNPRGAQLVMLAYRLAKYGHRNQTRDCGERYFEHPKRVALILMDERGIFDGPMLITALLHDIQENSFILTWDDIETIFGREIKEMIKILTKDREIEKILRDEIYSQGLLTSPREVRIIKLADRLDNMRCLEGCSPEKQKAYLKETVDFYLPLAEKTDKWFWLFIKNGCEKYTNKELP